MTSTSEGVRPFVLQVPAVADQLPSLREGLQGWLRDARCPAERAERLVLAANEAATNSIEHAYRGMPPGIVLMRAEVHRGGSVRIAVVDHGRWRPATPERGLRGRGVLMMQECSDRVWIDRSTAGTTVTIEASPVRYPDPAVEGDGHDLPFRISRETDDEHVIARVRGDVPDEAVGDLRKHLLAATCGGSRR